MSAQPFSQTPPAILPQLLQSFLIQTAKSAANQFAMRLMRYWQDTAMNS